MKLNYLITFIVSWIACLINNLKFLLVVKEFKSQSTTLATIHNLGEEWQNMNSEKQHDSLFYLWAIVKTLTFIGMK